MIRGLGRLLVLGTAALLVAGCGPSSSSGPAGTILPKGPTGPASFEPQRSDLAAVRKVLTQRAHAALTHDRSAFLAAVDDHDPSFVAQERTLYQNLARLPLASLTYTSDTSELLVPAAVGGGDPTLHPVVVEQLKLRGTTTTAISNSLDITFVRRDGRWLIGAESNQDDDGSGVASTIERPWWGVPIAVRVDGPLTVLVDRSRASSLGSLTTTVSDDIDVDAHLLGVPAQHALLVDATSNGTSTSFSSLSKEQAGAVTFALRHTDPSGDRFTAVAGMAIKINPHEVATLSSDTLLLRHELTHYLLHDYLGSSPTWLSEGVANWVEYYPDDYASLRLTGGLYPKLMHSDRELPGVGVFDYDPAVHYQVAQAAVAWLIDRAGMPRLLELMRAYRADYEGANVDALTTRLLRQVYGVTQQQVVAGAFGKIAKLQH
jgi:hypothetical protein